MARTQQQRREETVARLLDASIAAIVEVGYARASAAEITKRAGVSVGALFRHFNTMGDFMAATAQEVLRRDLDLFAQKSARLGVGRPDFDALLAIMRDITRSPANAVMYELMVAARTDEKLRATLEDVLAEYGAKIHGAVRSLPGSETVPGQTLDFVVVALLNMFDGAAIARTIAPQRDIGREQLKLLATLLDNAYRQGSSAAVPET